MGSLSSKSSNWIRIRLARTVRAERLTEGITQERLIRIALEPSSEGYSRAELKIHLATHEAIMNINVPRPLLRAASQLADDH
jgi:hypothetical protein